MEEPAPPVEVERILESPLNNKAGYFLTPVGRIKTFLWREKVWPIVSTTV
jgi:hypothetical protein